MEETEVEKPYPWTNGQEQAWRAFIIDAMANADILGEEMVRNMQIVYEWGTTGKLPTQKEKRKLSTVHLPQPDK